MMWTCEGCKVFIYNVNQFSDTNPGVDQEKFGGVERTGRSAPAEKGRGAADDQPVMTTER